MDLTPEQERGIKTVGKDLCVTAGPGAGKTLVLTRRYFHLVAKKEAGVGNILALTFTEKAAAEMKERVASLFEEGGMERQRREVESAHISTIHSFCSRLIREHAVESNIDPDFAILEEGEAKKLEEEVLRAMAAEWEEGKSGIPQALKQIPFNDFSSKFLPLYEKIRSTGIKPDEIFFPPAPELSKTVIPLLEEMASLGETILQGNPTARGRKLALLFPDFIKKLHRTAEKDLHGEGRRLLGEIQKSIQLNIIPKDLRERAKVFKESLEPAMEVLAQIEAGEPLHALRVFLSLFHHRYRKLKDEKSLLDFADLEEKAQELLSSRREIRESLRKKFVQILVDEYQDTNFLQKSIIDQVRGKGNHFAVGDVKQSIYGFRNADIKVFQEYQKEVKEEGLVELRKNFRSRPEIIAFSNTLFRSLWDEEGLPFRPSLPGKEFFPKKEPSVEVHFIRGADMDGARRTEASFIASRIREIVEEKILTISEKEHSGQSRDFRYSDIAVLLRSTTDIKLYEEALSGLQLPYFIIRGRGFFQIREVTDLANFLKLLDNPLDDTLFSSVLKSPFAGIRDESLMWLVLNRKRGQALFATLQERTLPPELPKSERQVLEGFMDAFLDLRSWKDRWPIWILIRRIYEKTCYPSTFLLNYQGKRKWANLMKITGIARSLEEKNLFSLNDFISHMEEKKYSEMGEREAPTDSEKDDAVRVMTIHAAKGLEFPIVVVGDLGRKRKASFDPALFHRERGLGIKIRDPFGGGPVKTAGFQSVLEAIQKGEEEEFLRLFYVAITRPKEHLILTGGFTRKPEAWMAFLAERLHLPLEETMDETISFEQGSISFSVHEAISQKDGAKKESLLRKHRKSFYSGRPVRTDFPDEVLEEGEKTWKRWLAPPLSGGEKHYLYTVTEVVQYHHCPRLYFYRYRLGIPEESLALSGGEERPVESGGEDELPPNRLGTAVHRILKEYDRGDEGSLRLTIRRILDKMPEKSFLQEEDRILQWIQRFYREGPGSWIGQNSIPFREVPFLFKDQELIFRGQIDLLFLTPDGEEVLLDYKLGWGEETPPSSLVLYENQMVLYAYALERIRGKAPSQVLLYFLSKGKSWPVSLRGEASGRARLLIKDFKDGTLGEEFPMKRGKHCSFCTYRALCGRNKA